jgi:uncharacterized membrane protein
LEEYIHTNVQISRLFPVDIARGLAIAGVVLFHLVWDLEFTGFISGLAFHPLWLAFGWVLAGTFMFLVGVSLVLAHGEKFRRNAFFRRIAIVLVAALAISVVTLLAFPDAFVFFGILHSIAVASIIGVAFLRLPVFVNILAGLIILALPWFISSQTFDPRWLAWIGFSASAPPSNDLVPVFPWAGLTLLGIASAKLLDLRNVQYVQEQTGADDLLVPWLVWMGRHSLAIYLLHQPLMLAVIIPLSRL